MTQRQTEMHHADADGLELRGDGDILTLLAKSQVDAAASVACAIDQIGAGAALMARSMESDGRLIYAAAGSSGLMALADALELPGTYGLSRERIHIVLAGGPESLVDMRGGPEDDGAAAEQAVTALAPTERDCLIAVTASGQTRFPMAAAKTARAAGAKTIGIANNSGAPLFEAVDVSICLPTPPEVIAGSTRMGAATAQKIALNMLSTLMAIHLGHVHDGYMVNLVADNEKLRERAQGIVAKVTGVDAARAAAALDACGGSVKAAILLSSGARDARHATQLLASHGGKIRAALATLGS
ncbi:MAG: N-acetylmuramic acid 6-phosphate etherase [Devosia sp.]|uniref:N-acetylmuramic acid 6-phosphate etherase n=1 Tax=Devosia sp. TaxID=1871048 RepID=UPI0024CDAAFA|nr:N-acetylmuramic acid 6-phosphate etherase [Devosia sp.]UYN99929.1 MAG: N-acetylmuramic acid 6-phosphate etherase [Devosia sp.]